MAKEREVKVKLVADVDEYVAAMKRAADATKALCDARRAIGPAAAEQIEIFTQEDGSTRVLVDGLDITYWISADGFSVIQGPNSSPRVSLSLVANRVTFN